MRAILDAIFKYLAWALFLLIAVMLEVTWGYADAVSQSYHTQQTIKLAVILLCGIIIIDILFALVGVYRRGSRKMIEHRAEKRAEARIREEQAAAAAAVGTGKKRRSIFFRKKEQLPPDDAQEGGEPVEYDAPIIVFPPADGGQPDEPGEDLSLRGRLRSALTAWVAPDEGGERQDGGDQD